MERFTSRDEAGKAWIGPGHNDGKSPAEQFAQYEETGMTPEDIKQLVVENKNLQLIKDEVEILNSRVDAQARRFDMALKADRWIPVGERLPEEEQEVLVISKNGNETDLRIYHNVGKQHWLQIFTHWRPLPQLPTR